MAGLAGSVVCDIDVIDVGNGQPQVTTERSDSPSPSTRAHERLSRLARILRAPGPAR